MDQAGCPRGLLRMGVRHEDLVCRILLRCSDFFPTENSCESQAANLPHVGVVFVAGNVIGALPCAEVERLRLLWVSLARELVRP